LLEDDVALGVGDRGGAEFPLDIVVGGHAGLGEEAAEGEAGSFLLINADSGLGPGFLFFSHFGHVFLLIR
jgi:hypothetical protein